MQFCPDKEERLPEYGQLLDIISSTVNIILLYDSLYEEVADCLLPHNVYILFLLFLIFPVQK